MDAGADIVLESSPAVIGGSEQETPERWEVDEARSRLSFTLTHLVVKQIHGAFESWGGTLFLDRRQPSLSSVHIWVDLSSLDTDSSERDAHVRSAEFFDVRQFPLATFKSTAVDVKKDPVVVNGRLELHGAVRDIELTVSPIAMPTSPSGEQRKTFSVQTKLDRQAFGLHWNQDLDAGGIVVGDNVQLEAHVEVVRSADER
jgi:polyisoprenoid-binding protein YceI